MRKIGIDFGTTNSALAILNSKGESELQRNEVDNSKTCKTAAFVQLNTLHKRTAQIFGIDAENFNRTYRKKIADNITQTEEWRYFNSIKMLLPLNADEFWMGNTKFSLMHICSNFIKNLVGNISIDNQFIFSVPVKYSENQCVNDLALMKFKKIISMTGIKNFNLVYEPVSALSYFFNQNKAFDLGEILVIDVGGGTTDVANAVLSDGNISIISTDGLSIGGGDFDLAITRAILQKRLGSGQLPSGFYDRFFTRTVGELNQLRAKDRYPQVSMPAQHSNDLLRFKNCIDIGNLGDLLDVTEIAKIKLNDDPKFEVEYPVLPACSVELDLEIISSLAPYRKLFDFFIRNQKPRCKHFTSLRYVGVCHRIDFHKK